VSPRRVWELLGGGDHQSVSPQTTTCNSGCMRDVFAPLCIGSSYCSADATQQLLQYWNLLLFWVEHRWRLCARRVCSSLYW